MSDIDARISRACAGGRLHGEEVLVKVYGTVREMLTDRGYALQSLCENSAGLLQHMRERRCVLQGVREGSGAQALVFFDLDDKVSVRFLRALREAHADALLIVVSLEGPTAFAKKEVADPWGEAVQHFTYKELVQNVSRHNLVPPHRVLDAAEAEEVRRRFSVKDEQLPLLLQNDPQRRYHGFRKGDVVEIRRRAVGAEMVLYYRRVGV